MKFIGSKSKLAKDIIPFLKPYLAKASLYIEPFVGGCNMIDKIEHPNRQAFDGNPNLIAMWQELVYSEFDLPETITKEQYAFIKSNRDKGYFSPPFLGFVGHNCSFSGDWFAGYAGTGEKRNRCLEAKKNILKQLKGLKGVVFKHNDYKNLPLYNNAVIYCDPPYYEGFKYKGSTYGFDHEHFWKWCREQAKSNVVFVSDYYAPDDFELIWQKEVTVNANQKNKKKAIEKLFKLEKERRL